MKIGNKIVLLLLFFITACSENGGKKPLGDDVKLFKNTPVWDLARAVEDENVDEIKELVNDKKMPVDYQEPHYGRSLLFFAVFTNKYKSCKALLECGADPNLPDSETGCSPFIEAADMGPDYNTDPKILKLLLSFGGDPNAIEKGDRKEGNGTRNTPLINAAGCCYEKTKILVEAGADVNFVNEYGGNAVGAASLYREDSEKILYYLIVEKKADPRLHYTVNINGDTLTILHALREWLCDIGSEEWKTKMKIVEYLKEKEGMDYYKTPVPKTVIENFPKEYIEKY